MHLGADASHLRWSTSGIARYCSGLLHALESAIGDGDEMTAFYNSLAAPKLFSWRVRERNLRMPGALAWNQVGLPLALLPRGCDVFLGPANIVPVMAGTPTVVVIHDCKAFRVPEAEPGRWGRYLRRWMRASAQHAERVIAVSRWTAAECEQFLGVSADRISVIHQGIDPRFHPAALGTGQDDLDRVATLGVSPPFVLQVSAFEQHKGGETAIDAVRVLRVARPTLRLVRCGQKGAIGVAEGVLDLGHVSDTDLVSLYRTAAAVCVTSIHEGFGLPVVEAMACGTPVVATAGSALPEAGGDAALYAPPRDAAAFAAALGVLLDDPDEALRRRSAGLLQSSRFSWEGSAARVLDVLRDSAAHERGSGRR
jgi:glycosyltransferase involved in cell wall biosynthesis